MAIVGRVAPGVCPARSRGSAPRYATVSAWAAVIRGVMSSGAQATSRSPGAGPPPCHCDSRPPVPTRWPVGEEVPDRDRRSQHRQAPTPSRRLSWARSGSGWGPRFATRNGRWWRPRCVLAGARGQPGGSRAPRPRRPRRPPHAARAPDPTRATVRHTRCRSIGVSSRRDTRPGYPPGCGLSRGPEDSVAQPLEGGGAALPILVDFDDQFQVDTFRKLGPHADAGFF
jgi:hypothetical protein